VSWSGHATELAMAQTELKGKPSHRRWLAEQPEMLRPAGMVRRLHPQTLYRYRRSRSYLRGAIICRFIRAALIERNFLEKISCDCQMRPVLRQAINFDVQLCRSFCWFMQLSSFQSLGRGAYPPIPRRMRRVASIDRICRRPSHNHRQAREQDGRLYAARSRLSGVRLRSLLNSLRRRLRALPA
jgi:hypothetical protein